jgi:hypothetical protein
MGTSKAHCPHCGSELRITVELPRERSLSVEHRFDDLIYRVASTWDDHEPPTKAQWRRRCRAINNGG